MNIVKKKKVDLKKEKVEIKQKKKKTLPLFHPACVSQEFIAFQGSAFFLYKVTCMHTPDSVFPQAWGPQSGNNPCWRWQKGAAGWSSEVFGIPSFTKSSRVGTDFYD